MGGSCLGTQLAWRPRKSHGKAMTSPVHLMSSYPPLLPLKTVDWCGIREGWYTWSPKDIVWYCAYIVSLTSRVHSISIAYEHVDFRILSLDHQLKLRRTLGQVEQGFCWTIAAFGFSLDSPRQVADLDPEVEVSYLDPPVLETYTEEPQEVRMRLLRLFVWRFVWDLYDVVGGYAFAEVNFTCSQVRIIPR